MNERWFRYAAFSAVWIIAGFILSLELYFNWRADSMGKPVVFWDLALPQFVRAAMWGCVAPFILRLREKLPLKRGRYFGGVAFHLGMSLVVMVTYYVGRHAWFFFLMDHSFAKFWTIIWKGFYGHNLVDIVFYWAVLGFGYSAEIYHRYKDQELRSAQLEARLSETELKALREQLNPHFLFNTLHTISVLVREHKNDDAVTLIARLSSLLRMTLENTRVQQVTVRQELDFIQSYVDIQKARFSDRLDVTIAVEPSAMEVRIPNLLLQPLVENAILHGVAAKPGRGHVELRGNVEGDRLLLEVRDDGPGFRADVGRLREGIGLTNTRERIAKMYGSRGQLSLRSERGRGVTVQIILPCQP